MTILNDILPALEKLYDATMKMSVDNNPTSSLILPIYMGLEQEFTALKRNRITTEGKIFTEKLLQGIHLYGILIAYYNKFRVPSSFEK